MQPSWETAFLARTDLQQYNSNAIGLFALALRFGYDDLTTIAADAITDGNDDKKCDIVHIDEDANICVIAQCYLAKKHKSSAPANKAGDLTTAITWLLQRPLNTLPEKILPVAKALREAITNGRVKTIHIWYTHNLPESKNVADELAAVQDVAEAALSKHFSASKNITVSVLEIGQQRFGEWHTDTLSPILVNDTFVIDCENGFEISGPNWSAFVTAIQASFIYQVYRQHKTKLFSANVRDYLGSRDSDSNINNGIKITAEKDPQDFWVFNNGLTVLVNTYQVPARRKMPIRLTIEGMSIVNGAQTSGAIGSLTKAPKGNALVPVRFVRTSNAELVRDIIRYNNSQNKVTASDFRSTDKVQKRLREEFRNIPYAEYEGGRRGGFGDTIKRRPNLLPSYTVGQALAAVHGDPMKAYHAKSDIWNDDRLYAKFFNEETTAQHIVFAYSLLRAVESKKLELVAKSKESEDAMTTVEHDYLKFFRQRGSTFLLVSAISVSLESLIGHKIYNRFKVTFGKRVSPTQAQGFWEPVVETTLPFSRHLQEALSDGLKNSQNVEKAITTFQSLVQATVPANAERYKEFTSHLAIEGISMPKKRTNK